MTEKEITQLLFSGETLESLENLLMEYNLDTITNTIIDSLQKVMIIEKVDKIANNTFDISGKLLYKIKTKVDENSTKTYTAQVAGTLRFCIGLEENEIQIELKMNNSLMWSYNWFLKREHFNLKKIIKTYRGVYGVAPSGIMRQLSQVIWYDCNGNTKNSAEIVKGLVSDRVYNEYVWLRWCR